MVETAYESTHALGSQSRAAMRTSVRLIRLSLVAILALLHPCTAADVWPAPQHSVQQLPLLAPILRFQLPFPAPIQSDSDHVRH